MDRYDRETLEYLKGCGCGNALLERVQRIIKERDDAQALLRDTAKKLRDTPLHPDANLI